MEANQHHPRRSSLDHDNEMHLLSHQQPPALPPVAIMPLSLPLQSNSSTFTAAAATASSCPPSSVTTMGGGPTVLLHQRSELRRSFTATPPPHHHHHHHQRTLSSSSSLLRKANNEHHRTLTKYALIQNDSMVYLDGPTLYTCGNCRTHLTSHDDIISKSFHGRHGRAYLFDQCVNITHGPAEDRILITGLHSVSDIYCKRCKTLIGWTYNRAYESSQKYKEKKYIIEKIYLHLEVSDGGVYDGVNSPAGERCDRFRARSMSWGSNCSIRTRGVSAGSYGEITTTPTLSSSSWLDSPGGYLSSSRSRSRSGSGSPYIVRTPPTATSTRGSSPTVPMMSPNLPNDIIYEYR